MKRLDEATGGAASDPDNSIYGLGFDWVKIYNHRQHSVGIVGIRIEDVGSLEGSKRDSFAPVMIIPGPNMPAEIDVYFKPLVDDLVKHGPTGVGIEVTIPEYIDSKTGLCVPSKALSHKVIICGIYCDSQARAKLAKSMMSAMAYLPCYFCWLCAVRDATRMLMLGYSKGTTADRGKLRGREVRMGNKEHTKMRVLDHDGQARRAAFCQHHKKNDPVDFKQVVSALGCHGDSYVFQKLTYLDRVFAWILPFFHTVMLGVVKGFLKVILGKADGELEGSELFKINNINRIKALEGNFILSADFLRPYEPVEYVRMWNIEQTTRFIEFFSSFLFNPNVVFGQPTTSNATLLSPLAKTAWGHLRRFVLHHLRTDTLTFCKDQRTAARENILNFSAIMEEVLPSMCTLNLHLMNCQLYRQESTCGLVIERHELWVEQLMQVAKPRTRTVFARFPEHSLAMKLLMEDYIAGE